MNKYYQEAKQKIDAIREKYSSAGDVIFRAVICTLLETGTQTLCNIAPLDENDPEHRVENAVMNCAHELAQIGILPLLAYVQREIYFGADGISYKRAIELLKRTIDVLIEELAEYAHEGCTLYDLREAGFKDAEIEELGFGYLFDTEEEE